MNYDAVFFISFGGPEKPDDIMPFLEIVTRGRNIPRARLEEVAHHYEHMGGKSPINEITRQQAEALRRALAQTSNPQPVYIGQRNWHPFIEDTLRTMRADGIQRAIGFCTAAHRSEASLERYVNAVESARQALGPGAPVIDYVGPWFDHPLFIEAICARISEVRIGGSEGRRLGEKSPSLRPLDPPILRMPWVFTAHSIPCSMAKESTYVEELRATAGAVARKLGQADWQLAYTSRSGSPQDAWLEPDVSDVIRAKASQGVKEILAIPIGFVADHVEVLFDLDVEAKETADACGVTLQRAKTVGDHPLFIQMIADVIREGPPAQAELGISSMLTSFRGGPVAPAVGRASTACYCFPGQTDPPCCRRPVSATLKKL